MLTKITVLLGVTTLFASCNAAADDEKRSTEYYPEIEITGLLLGAVHSEYYKYPYVGYTTDILTRYFQLQKKGRGLGRRKTTSWWLDSDTFDDRHNTFVVEREVIRTRDDTNHEILFVQLYDRPDGSKWIRWMTEDGFMEALKDMSNYYFSCGFNDFERNEFQPNKWTFDKCLTFDRIKSRTETINKCWEKDISVEELDISFVISTPGMRSILKSGLLTFPQEIIEIIVSFSETKTPLNPLLETAAVLQDAKWIFKPNPYSIFTGTCNMGVAELKRDFSYGDGKSKVTIKSGTPAQVFRFDQDPSGQPIRVKSGEVCAVFTGIINGQEETIIHLPIHYFQKRPWEEIKRFLLATGKWSEQDWVDQD